MRRVLHGIGAVFVFGLAIPTFGAEAFRPWIEELFRRGVVAGSGGGNYCPASPVTREQMGVFLTQTFALRLNAP